MTLTSTAVFVGAAAGVAALGLMHTRAGAGMAGPGHHLHRALRARRLDRPDQPEILRTPREGAEGQADRREQARRFGHHRHRCGVRAAPDGYTIGLGSNSSLAYQPLEMKGLAWKDTDGYQSVVKLADLPSILGVPADSSFKTFDDFIDEAKKNPGKLKVSVSGLRTAPDLAMQHFNKLSGLRVATVPFTGGGGEALLAALGGRVDGTVGYRRDHEGPGRRRQAARSRDLQRRQILPLPRRQADRRDAVEILHAAPPTM